MCDKTNFLLTVINISSHYVGGLHPLCRKIDSWREVVSFPALDLVINYYSQTQWRNHPLTNEGEAWGLLIYEGAQSDGFPS